jgi:quinol monooxygenase YgiN
LAKALGVDTEAPGLVSWDVFEHLVDSGKVIAVLTWRDHAAAEAFLAKPAAADSARQRNVRVIREYGMFDRREAPAYFKEAQAKA